MTSCTPGEGGGGACTRVRVRVLANDGKELDFHSRGNVRHPGGSDGGGEDKVFEVVVPRAKVRLAVHLKFTVFKVGPVARGRTTQILAHR